MANTKSKSVSDDGNATVNDPVVEATYSIDELKSAAASRFQTRPEVVVAALKGAGKDRATLEEAKKLIGEFLRKEIK